MERQNRKRGQVTARKNGPPPTNDKYAFLLACGADTYGEQEVETNADEDTYRCMLVKKILVHWDAVEEADDTAWFQFQVNRQSKAALLTPTDQDCICQKKITHLGAVAAGMEVQKSPIDLLEDVGPLLFGSRQFYIAADFLTGDAENFYFEIWYEDVMVSAAKFNRSW